MSSPSRRNLLLTTAATLLAAKLPSWAQSAHTAPASKLADTQWLSYGNDLTSSHYAPLDQINASNFNELEVAWRFSTDALGPRLDAYYNATPLAANGRILTTAGFRRDVVALDAATGEQLWAFRYDEGERNGSRGGSGLGCSYWTDGTNERVLFVTIGYQMISLDAKTGIPDPDFGKNGVVDLRENDDQVIDMVNGVIGLHAAPLVVRNVVVVGSAPTESVKGYLRGFDVKTGQRKWIFHTIPQRGEFGYDTWIRPGQALSVGNTGVWASMSADPELGLLYAGVELPSGDHFGFSRQGDALFGETLVALDIETGIRKWHYQLTHHGLQDRDVCCAAILCDIPVDGKIVKAIAQPSKQAYIYVLDRETGKPIWPIPEMAAPKGDVPGEWYSPTQPIPSKPPAFDQQGTSPDILNDWTPEIRARALAIAGHYRMGSLYTPPALTEPGGPWGTMTLPGNQGGANWPGGSYDPQTHMLYIYSKTSIEVLGLAETAPGRFDDNGLFKTRNINDSDGGEFGGLASVTGGAVSPASRRNRRGVDDSITAPIVPGLLSIAGLPIHKPPYGRITAIDLTKGTLAWQVAHGETPDLIRNHPLLKGISIPRTGQAGILGTLTTKTLVICGDCGLFTDEKGRKGARLRAYDKMTGQEKGAVFMDKVQTGTPMTYVLGGRQYIVLAVGRSNGADLVAYRLPT